MNYEESLRLEMNNLCRREKLDLSILMVTDIIIGGTELIVAGENRKLVDLAFGLHPDEFSKFMPGVFSRKKQIVPPLMNASAY